jgi:site-specific recombinase XerD
MEDYGMATPKYLTMNEMLAVLGEAKKTSIRNWTICLFAFRFGLRCQELASLTLNNVKNGMLDLQRLKGSEHTVDEITSNPNPMLDAQAALAAWMRERNRAGETSCFLFVSRLGSGMTPRAIYNIFENAAFRAGIDADRRNIHISKHSLGVCLRKAGVDLATIAKTLGHKDPATTIRYYQHVDRDEVKVAVTRAFAKLAPVAA